MNRAELLAYRAAFEHELRHNILAYWRQHAVTPDGAGFHGAVDLANRPVPGAPKSCVVTARILWTFAHAARAYGDPADAAMADRAYQVLTTRFWDAEHGGFFMTLTAADEVADAIKHTYAQAFALYALSAHHHYRPTPEGLAFLTRAAEAFETRTKDPARPGYREAFTRDWAPLAENRMADHNEPRSMNTHLHVLEAYTALVRVLPAPLYRARLRELVTLFLERILRPSGHLGIFFDEAFEETPASRGICSFGHDIEAAWLLPEAAEALGDPALRAQAEAAGVRLAGAVARVGLDRGGGLFLESTRFGSQVRTNKHWWVQAEALVGFLHAYDLTGEARFWEAFAETWRFVDAHVIDHHGGEWFTKVNRLGEPYRVEPPDDPSPYYRNDWKIDPWKCPYHNGRACLEVIRRLDERLARLPG